MAFLEVPSISTGMAPTLSSFISDLVTLQKAVQTSSQSPGLANLAQTRFLNMQVHVERQNQRAVKKIGNILIENDSTEVETSPFAHPVETSPFAHPCSAV